jgi:hypothetical protein
MKHCFGLTNIFFIFLATFGVKSIHSQTVLDLSKLGNESYVVKDGVYFLRNEILLEEEDQIEFPYGCKIYLLEKKEDTCRGKILNQNFINNYLLNDKIFNLEPITLSHSWQTTNSDIKSGMGTGIYFLPLRNGNHEYYYFELINFFHGYASRVWMYQGGTLELLFRAGRVSKIEKKFIPYWDLMQAGTRVEGNGILVLEVGNFGYGNGWLDRFALGKGKYSNYNFFSFIFLDTLMMGISLIFGFYHILLYFVRKQNLDAFYFGIFCLSFFGKTLLTSVISTPVFGFTTESFVLRYKLIYLFIHLVGTNFLLYFYYLTNQSIHKKVIQFYLVYSFLYIIIVAFIPTVYIGFYPFIFLSSSILTLFLLSGYIAFFAFSKKYLVERVYSSRLFIFVLFLILFYTSDVLHHIGVLHSVYSNTITIGFAFVILGQGWIIADKNAEAWRSSEKLASSLEKEIREKKDLQVSTLQLTQQKEEIHKELNDATSQLIQAEKLSSLGAMVAGISHEISNPVNFIETSRFSLKEEVEEMKKYLYSMIPDTDEAKVFRESLEKKFQSLEEGIGNISFGVKRVTEINQSMRNAARSDDHATSSVHLEDIMEEAILILGSKLKSFEIQKEFGTLPDVTVKRSHIGQVFMNILSNACDALHEKRSKDKEFLGKIRIILIQSGNDIEVSIEDNGPGIPDESKSKVMNAFYTTKPPGVGTGLGLAICGKIISDHKGKIQIKDSPWGGAKFIINIPI